MRKYLALALLLLTLPAAAQQLGPVNPPYVQGPASATSGHIATFSGVTGKIIADGGVVPTSAPCSAFGTTAGTCAQGGVITGAGPTGSATVAPIITYNSAGQLTTVTSATVTPAIGSVTGLGTNVATAAGNTLNATGGLTSQTGPTAWTPADASGAALTFGGVSAQYTKIGNMVFAYAFWNYPSTSDTNSAQFNGLPINMANANYARQCTLNFTGATTAIHLLGTAGGDTVGFYTSAGAQLQNIALSGQSVIVMCIYPAA